VPAYEAAPDYNLCTYSLFVGRPLAGMRAYDIRCALDFLAGRPEVEEKDIALVGRGLGAFSGLLAAASDQRITAVAAEELLGTWVFPEEFNHIGLSYLVPRMLTMGDMAHLAACVAPRPLLLVNPVDGQRRPMGEDAARTALRPAEQVYGLFQAGARFDRRRVESKDLGDVVLAWLRQQGTTTRE
jgi:hypothetical protein